MTKRAKRFTCVFAMLLLLLIGACTIYVQDYYRAEPEAVEALSASGAYITVTAGKNNLIFAPKAPKAGLIFYPGGKVEYSAYAPLMRMLAEQDILCILLKMPCNLAVLDPNAADGLPEQFPEVPDWYLGGHSLGGAMAASYAAKHTEDYAGLLLLASYATKDLSQSGLTVFSLYGTEDHVLNRDSYAKNRGNLPENTTEILIDGGNHAQFGAYGAQKGDGTATISRTEQLQCVADCFCPAVMEYAA